MMLIAPVELKTSLECHPHNLAQVGPFPLSSKSTAHPSWILRYRRLWSLPWQLKILFIRSVLTPKVVSGVKNGSVNISCTHSLWAPHPDQVRNLSLLIQCRRILARPVFPPSRLLHWAIEGLPTGDLAGHRKKLLINHLSSSPPSFFLHRLHPYLESLDISFPHQVLLLSILSLRHAVSSNILHTLQVMFFTKGLYLILNEWFIHKTELVFTFDQHFEKT